MKALMEARSVAVVGASERADASSSFVMKNLLACGFGGEILPINPRGGTIFGLPAVPRLADLSRAPDAVVVAISAAMAAGAVAEASAIGIKAAVVLASGFAETDAEGATRQAALAVAARGMALCGPNCLGLYNLRNGLALFSSSLSPTMRRGDVAVVSHSGAGAITLANSGQIGLSHIVSAGNAAVSDIPDFIRYFAESSATKVVALVLEQIADPTAFAAAMVAAHAAGVPVVALRSGRSERGAAATASHTGALAGSNEAFAAFFRRHGVIEAPDMDTLLQTCVLLSAKQPRPSCAGLAALGVSGGGLAQLADLTATAGLGWAEISDATRAALGDILPSYVRPNMPLDLTGIVFGEPQRYLAALNALAADPAVGQIVALQDAPVGLDTAGAEEYVGIAGAIAAYARTGTKPIAVLSLLGSGLHRLVADILADVPVLQGGTSGTAALARALTAARPAPAAAPITPPDPAWLARLSSGPALTEREAKNFLRAHGIPTTEEALATSADDAAMIAARIGFPVVLKIESPDILHKTEAGGVRLGITDAQAARAAFADIVARARAYAPNAAIAGVLVQEMVSGGTEALVGLSRHAPFGLALTLGPGGVLVDLLGGHALDLLPPDAEALIDATKLAPLIAGFRGTPPGDRAAFARLVTSLGEIGRSYGAEIAAIDLNPVSILPTGVRVLDALIIRRIDAEGPTT
jgi:acyl-CoA synthetase (NDP forming)